MREAAATVPPELTGPGRIERRQATYWDLRPVPMSSMFRIHFTAKQEARFESPVYEQVAMVDTHPLLIPYGQRWISLFVVEAQRCGPTLLEDLATRIADATSGWWRSEEYLRLGGSTEPPPWRLDAARRIRRRRTVRTATRRSLKTDARTARSAASARMASGGFAPDTRGGTQAQGRDFVAPEFHGVEHADGSGASGVNAWTAGGLRSAGSLPPLPPVQFELFTEAGAIVAARLARQDATEVALASVLGRAANQAGRLVSLRLSSSPAGENAPNAKQRGLTDRGEPR